MPAMEQTNPHDVAAQIKSLARGLGFDLVGIAPADPPRHREYFRRWLDAGRHGSMKYLEDRFHERVDPSTYLPDVKTVICVAVNYNPAPLKPRASAPDPTPSTHQTPSGQIARYARSTDYHDWIKPRLYAIADWLRDTLPGTKTVCGVDTAPVLEREFAARAGIGWVGKNTIVLNERLGSWLFLAEVLTTAELPVDSPSVDRCGTCTRCIEACPTDAIVAPYQLDASRCISYLTIEHEGGIEPSLSSRMGAWIYGCDICQEVCPWNNRAPLAELPELSPRIPASLPLDEVLKWQKDDFDRAFRRTAVKRIRLPILQRNAAIARENKQRATTSAEH